MWLDVSRKRPGCCKTKAMLSLTLPAAQRRFGLDGVTCAGVLGALVEARVLTEREGAYRRYVPRPAVRRAA
jgi:hypothetical protein